MDINSFYWIQLSRCLPKFPFFDRRRNGFPISHFVLNIRQWIKNRKPVIISLDFVIVRTYEESLHLSYYKINLIWNIPSSIKIMGIWDFMLHDFAVGTNILVEECEILHPENGDIRFLQAVVTYVPDHKMSHPKDKSLHICQYENLISFFLNVICTEITSKAHNAVCQHSNMF